MLCEEYIVICRRGIVKVAVVMNIGLKFKKVVSVVVLVLVAVAAAAVVVAVVVAP